VTLLFEYQAAGAVFLSKTLMTRVRGSGFGV
jgi:hypothetical protein